jgi:hypothetical protein
VTAPDSSHTSCKFGHTEHDGSKFCHEHCGFLHAGSPPGSRCDTSWRSYSGLDRSVHLPPLRPLEEFSDQKATDPDTEKLPPWNGWPTDV